MIVTKDLPSAQQVVADALRTNLPLRMSPGQIADAVVANLDAAGLLKQPDELAEFRLSGNNYGEGSVYCLCCYQHSPTDSTLAEAVIWSQQHGPCTPMYADEGWTPFQDEQGRTWYRRVKR